MQTTTPKISLVIPVFNEREVIPELFKRLEHVAVSHSENFQLSIIFVDDGSTDESVNIIKQTPTNLEFKLIQFSRNFGHQAAVMAGITNADGDAVVIMDADLQDPPEIIVEFVKQWQKGFHVVYGKRISRDGESLFKKTSAATFYRILHWLTEVEIPFDSGDFRLIDKKVADSLKGMNEKSIFIRGIIAWMGYRQTPVEYHREARFAGNTKYPLKKMIALASDAVLAFSEKPLRLISKIGGAIFIAAISVSVFVLSAKIFGSGYEAPGWISIMLAILTLSGFQILCLGVIGSYVLRVYRQTRNRPVFLVMDEYNNYG
jgi:glycosyltransferase involved in cell wall biosynthesis